MITRDGKAALVHKQPTDAQVSVGKTAYFFTTRRGIALAWVAEADVPAVLSVKAGCNCGGRQNTKFQPASEGQVRIWEGADR